MSDVRRIGRRTWLARSASGLVALWAGLDFGLGRQGWGVLLGTVPRRAAAAQGATQTLPVGIEFEFGAQRFSVNAFVLVRGREVAIVDTLVPGNADRIGATIQSAGLGWDAVRHVILTHYHADHSGSVEEVGGRALQATIWAGEADIPQISLSRPISPAADGDEVFGLRIVATPGHTPGHISVLDPLNSALLTGDAVFNMEGVLTGVIPEFTTDVGQANESIRKLGSMSFERALFAHGPPIESGASAAIARLAASSNRTEGLHALEHALRRCCL